MIEDMTIRGIGPKTQRDDDTIPKGQVSRSAMGDAVVILTSGSKQFRFGRVENPHGSVRSMPFKGLREARHAAVAAVLFLPHVTH
jgi:hypothetical protein